MHVSRNGTARAAMTLGLLTVFGIGGCDQLAAGVGQVVLALMTMLLVAVLLLEGALVVGALVALWRQRGDVALLVMTLVACGLHGCGAFALATDALDSRGSVLPLERVACLTVALPVLALIVAAGALLGKRVWRGWVLAGAVIASGLVGFEVAAALRAAAVPPPAASGAPEQIVTGRGHACMLTSTGAVACWGDNRSFQLGSGMQPMERKWPKAVTGLTGATALVSAWEFTCALRSGQVVCWGANQDGPLGPEVPLSNPVPVPVPLAGVDGAVELHASRHRLRVRTAAGKLFTWGHVDNEIAPEPPERSLPSDTRQLVATERYFCVRRQSGNIGCRADAAEYVEVPTVPLVALAAGKEQLCGAGADGHVQCWSPWGLAQALQQRQKDADQTCEQAKQVEKMKARPGGRRATKSPVERLLAECEAAQKRVGAPLAGEVVTGITDAVELVAGPGHFCARTRDGQVLCWGKGYHGELGDGTLGAHADARPATLPGPAAQVFASDLMSCARLTDGRFFCWGGQSTVLPANGLTLCEDSFLVRANCAPRPVELAIFKHSTGAQGKE